MNFRTERPSRDARAFEDGQPKVNAAAVLHRVRFYDPTELQGRELENFAFHSRLCIPSPITAACNEDLRVAVDISSAVDGNGDSHRGAAGTAAAISTVPAVSAGTGG